MKTNFFELVAGLNFKGNLSVNINNHVDDKQTVSVHLVNTQQIGSQPNLPPLIFNGSPSELGEGFFTQLTSPIRQTTELLANLHAYQAELEKAKKTAKTEKGKSAKSQPVDEEHDDVEETDDLFKTQPDDKQAKAEKKRLFDDAMVKVKELAKQMKYTEALAHLPSADDYPEQAELIVAKKQEVQSGKDLYDKLQEQFND
ncbi:hypothetical protein [Mucilaginibacter ginkgonis]|uniref:ParB-related ThiF-related cassette protein E domain-containing protein n=1 Tax=Mucilaginibacter ginkgonis TaxID=2682091 RepID=A0A6I4IMN4_9SPHI|nr:hypothetical protein [Mucilaginibacter ginkgonis]QQL49999.1 hypothetical protein GO620_000685 [Mucilaginibacter ginkgonis]